MNDMKKVLIVAISVVLVIAIAAGVSIGVMANTMNGLKDRVEELNQAYASDKAAMMAEIEAAKAANENLVTAADFEAKLAAAIGEQNQTMQSLISTAVKNQIEELGTEGLTEAQVQAIIDAAVENCLTEADIDAIIADVDTGLTKAEVKKLITDNTAGYLTYAQIMNLIDDADYDLRAYLEKTLTEDMITLVKELEAKLGKDLSDVKDELAGKIEDVEGNLDSVEDQLAWEELIEDKTVVTTTTAQDLIYAAQEGDEIVLDAGTYDELIIANADGSAKKDLTIYAHKDAKVGFINLNGSSFITLDGITFDAAGAQTVYRARTDNGSTSTAYQANITGSETPDPAHDIVIQNCIFTGNPVTISETGGYVSIAFEEGSSADRAWNITINNNTFASNAFSYIRLNYVKKGTIEITNNVFGGENYWTAHNTMNFTGNSSDLVITDNKFYNWNVADNAIGSSRQDIHTINVTITDNTFSNDTLSSEGGVIELKSSYTTANSTVTIEDNTYTGELNYTDATAPIVKPE